MAALAGGLIALVLGIIGIIGWWGYFVKALMAALPAMFILGGALAAYLGFEEIKDKKATDSFQDTTDPNDNVQELKAEISQLKKEKEDLEKTTKSSK